MSQRKTDTENVDSRLTHIASETLDTAARLPVYAEIRVLGAATPEEISEEMGVGVERVRKSLRQLENEGIVEKRKGGEKDVYTALTPTELVGNLPYAVRVRMKSILDI